MGSLLITMRGAIAIGFAVCVCAAPCGAGQATFISGFAANNVLSTYRDLAARRAVPPVVSPAANVSVTVRESRDRFSITFHGVDDPAASSDSRGAATTARSPSSRAYFSSLDAGTKTLGAVQTSALLTAMDFAEQHPSRFDSVRRSALAGDYVLEVFERGDAYIFVSMSYPGSAALRKTAIGCNPQRQFRYEASNNAVTEVKDPCS